MHKPLRQLGQNFLQNLSLARKVLDASNPCLTDNFIEIGPGKGAFTMLLAPRVSHLTCVEIDPFLTQFLTEEVKKTKSHNIEVVNQNILTFTPSEKLRNYRVMGALPYNISKKIIKHFFEEVPVRPIDMFLILQKEVAENYTAKPPNATFLSNYARLYSIPKLHFTIGKNNFFPKPKVDSALIQFTMVEPESNSIQAAHFFKLLFCNPRKTAMNNLSHIFDVRNSKSAARILQLVGNARPQELTFEALKELFMMYNTAQNEEEQEN